MKRNEPTKIIPRRNWPVGTYPDGRLYEVAVCNNMRARMAENDTATDTPAMNDLGEFDWLFVDPDRTIVPDLDYEREGTYVEISAFCDKLNNRMDKFGKRPFVFYPHPKQEVKAA